MRTAFALTVVLLLVESAAGVASHSLALLSDAGHIFTDVFALGLAWFAVDQSRKPSDARRTYGYHRVGILAALANAVILVAIVVGVLYEAARRFAHPHHVQGVLVIVAAAVAIVVNSSIALSLRGAGRSLNVRAATLHVVGDLVASLGVIVSGVIVVTTTWPYADPLVSVGIAALIAFGSVRLILESVNILLEGIPRGMDLDAVRAEIDSTLGVDEVHDLHVWSLSAEQVALSCHVVVDSQHLAEDVEHLVRDVEQRICARFDIGHTTIQVEVCHPCDGEIDHGSGDHNHPHVAASGE